MLLKQRFEEFAETIDQEITTFIQNSVLNNDFRFAGYKVQVVTIDTLLKSLEKRNVTSNINLFEIYNSLQTIEKQLQDLEKQDVGAKKCLDKISGLSIKIDCNKNNLLNSVALKYNSIFGDVEQYNQNSLLFQTMSDMDADPIKDNIDVPEMEVDFELNKQSILGSQLDIEIRSINDGTNKRNKTLLKHNSIHNLFVSHMNKGLDSKETFSGFETKPTHGSIIDTDNYIRHMLPSSLSSDNLHLNYSSTNLSPNNLQNVGHNIYKPLSPSQVFIQRSATNLTLRKMILRDISSCRLTYELINKNQTINIKNSCISQFEFGKIITDAMEKKKIVNRIDFRDNTFNFDVLLYLKEYFVEPLFKTFHIDLRRNRLKVNNRNIEFIKKHLFLYNVKVLV